MRRLFSVCALGLVLSVAVGPARAAEPEAGEARAFHEKAKAAFALSHYAQAAEYFEKAFEVKSDPAFLYNAAQAHRLAGNKERALSLYQNYLRVYGRDERMASIDSRIEELKRAIERDRAAGITPPVTPPAPVASGSATPVAPPAGAKTSPNSASTSGSSSTAPSLPVADATPAPLVPPAPRPAADSGAAPVLVAQPGPAAGDDRSVTRKPWFWIALGGGVAVAVVAVLFLTMGGSKDPSASFGQASGN